ncbi:hypothetical protein [Virgisporangium aurantiacum]|uniref:Uncharacterized protein n=1 Tax=Virgisporangium aurantiacum TaxID=175570 RepID=A0A8J4E768_9ACTN|nr:hypothetical protein [Virgisporangium aurantiacum]GIJ64211.1 hypothetical protein Vau01_117270 [Virgisporangium aurantiacum]
MTGFDEWLPRRVAAADALLLDDIVVPVSPETSRGLVDVLRSWWEHLAKFEADLLLPPDDHSIWGAHDYVAGLIIRDRLAGAISRLDPTLAGRIDSAVSEVDRRFTDFTEHDDDGCTGRVDGRVDPGRGWWWRRVPIRGPIREELRLHYGHQGAPAGQE